MAILSVAEIMQVQDITEQEVPVPQWGGSVIVRSISHREMREIKKKIAASTGEDGEVNEDDVEKYVLLKGMINPTISEEEYEHLLEKSTQAITTILTAILSTSKTSPEAVKQEERTFPAGTE